MQEMAVLMGAQQGASIANEQINEEFTTLGKAIMGNQNNLQASMSTFSSTLDTLQSKEVTAINDIFIKAATHIQDQQSDQNNYFQQMNQYVNESVSKQQPKSYYLLDKAAYLDELFAAGSMYTPVGPTWKNVFTQGNWEYDHLTKSFWQMQATPLPTSAKNNHDIMLNSIFTEYFTSKNSYDIVCKVVIHQVSYPFFVGIMFNKTRWVSGSMDSITKCRLFGLYGAAEKQIATYFTEQHEQKTTSGITTRYPLEQIINKQATPQQSLDNIAFARLFEEPLTLLIRITTSASTITYKIWQQGTKEPIEGQTIKSLDKDLYLYHNIGFICPGAVAEFSLAQPTELTFSKQAQTQFAQEVEQLLTSPKR